MIHNTTNMTENNKCGKQTRHLMQDLYAGSVVAMPFPRLSGNAWLSDRTRERRRRQRTKMKEFSTVFEEPTLTSSSSVSLSTTMSGLAKRSKTSSGNKNTPGSNQSTLSMISTPWSSESSGTMTSHGKNPLRWRQFSGSTNMTTSLEPLTTTTIGGSSSNGLSAFVSKGSTQSFDKERSEQVKFVQIEEHEEQRSPFCSSSLTSSWNLDAFSSTELFSDRVKVKYPWSPSTNDQIDISIDYPSSFTLVSQKCSWDTIRGRYSMKEYTPMNHLPYSGDIHPNHDWMLVKEKGITSSPV